MRVEVFSNIINYNATAGCNMKHFKGGSKKDEKKNEQQQK